MTPPCPRSDDLANPRLACRPSGWQVEGVDLREVARELCTGDPVDFVTARNAAAARARESGDTGLAERIKKLRKPTTSAWAVNLLADRDPDELGALLDLGDRLRQAQRELRGDELRDLAAERTRLLDRLTTRAAELAVEGGHEIADSGREQITQTLTAALSDPEAAAEVQRATLTKPLEYSGFGLDDLAVAAIQRQAARPRTSRKSEESGEGKVLELRNRLRDSEKHLDAAAAELTRAETACREAEERHERLREELADAEAELRVRRRDVKTARQEHERAVKAKDAAARALGED
ncbi:hypothetical protein QFW96_22770 [Saccharopolyspora sp. TS4A08]|uniref:Transposase n=1 Tax=Saccharopolyspora ipomoeae TaxID=3042027 RepID=A0ABT6PTY4_9PSEU|nr:hypothetical protein [Saccharopolyspora sp. TS4A08]